MQLMLTKQTEVIENLSNDNLPSSLQLHIEKTEQEPKERTVQTQTNQTGGEEEEVRKLRTAAIQAEHQYKHTQFVASREMDRINCQNASLSGKNNTLFDEIMNLRSDNGSLVLELELQKKKSLIREKYSQILATAGPPIPAKDDKTVPNNKASTTNIIGKTNKIDNTHTAKYNKDAETRLFDKKKRKPSKLQTFNPLGNKENCNRNIPDNASAVTKRTDKKKRKPLLTLYT